MIRMVFMGSPEFAVPSLAALTAASHEIVGVYTQSDKPAGRGQKMTAPAVKAWAQEHGLPVLQPPTLRSAEALEQLRALQPDVIVVAAYGKLLPETVLAVPPKGVLNLHPSLLPEYRGPTPIQSAILAGDDETGVTVMLLDAGMDTGPILAQRPVRIAPEDTAETLAERLAVEGAEILRETVERWMRGEIVPMPQNNALATYSKLLEKEDGEIDWTASAVDLERKVRALAPWPGAYSRWRGSLLKVLTAKAAASGEGAPGTVVALPGGGAGVITGKGSLALGRVQLEGRQQMTARELVAGRHDFVGSRLPS